MRELYVGTFDCACYISSTGAGFWPKVAGEARRMAFYNCLRWKNVILTLFVTAPSGNDRKSLPASLLQREESDLRVAPIPTFPYMRGKELDATQPMSSLS